jgi:hypothetical protein
VAGLLRGQWCGLKEMRQLTHSKAGRHKLSTVAIRFYGEAAYTQQWREIVNPSGSSAIDDSTACGRSPLLGELADQMQQAGISHQELATHLGKSRPFVTMALRGRRSWPAGLLDKAITYVHGRCVRHESYSS